MRRRRRKCRSSSNISSSYRSSNSSSYRSSRSSSSRSRRSNRVQKREGRSCPSMALRPLRGFDQGRSPLSRLSRVERMVLWHWRFVRVRPWIPTRRYRGPSTALRGLPRVI